MKSCSICICSSQYVRPSQAARQEVSSQCPATKQIRNAVSSPCKYCPATCNVQLQCMYRSRQMCINTSIPVSAGDCVFMCVFSMYVSVFLFVCVCPCVRLCVCVFLWVCVFVFVFYLRVCVCLSVSIE